MPASGYWPDIWTFSVVAGQWPEVARHFPNFQGTRIIYTEPAAAVTMLLNCSALDKHCMNISTHSPKAKYNFFLSNTSKTEEMRVRSKAIPVLGSKITSAFAFQPIEQIRKLLVRPSRAKVCMVIAENKCVYNRTTTISTAGDREDTFPCLVYTPNCVKVQTASVECNFYAPSH